MGTKNFYENGPNPFFSFGTKSLVRVWQRFCFNMIKTTSLSFFCLCGGDTTMKLPNENSQVFKTRRVRYARADELKLYGSSSTTSPVKRRHQLTLRFYSCSCVVGG